MIDQANLGELLAKLEAPFDAEQVRTRQGRGGIALKWVDARTIAARLDAVLGLDGWEWRVQREQDGVVIGTLTIHLPNGKSITRQDFGYMTGGSGEDLKEATSDALRRCASLFGAGRYLYAFAGGDAAPSPRAQIAEDVRLAAAAAQIFDTKEKVTETLATLSGSGDGGCPQHQQPWTLKPAGVSKAGKAYNAFYTCTGKNADGSYCKEKPSLRWLSANKPAPAAKLVPETQMEDFPF